MEIKEEKIIPAQPESKKMVTVAIQCDICSEQTNHNSYWPDDEYRDASVDVSFLRETQLHGDGGQSKEIKYDICPKCFETVLMPFLESKGAKPQVEYNDW